MSHLGHSPPCISEAFRPTSALRSVLRALQRFEIPYWIDQGSLLGLVREGQFMRGDSDIDISVWRADIQKRERKFAEDLRGCGLRVSRFKPDVIRIRKDGEKALIHIAYHHPDGATARKFYYYLPRVNFSLSVLYALIDGVIRELEKLHLPPRHISRLRSKVLKRLIPTRCVDILLIIFSHLHYLARHKVAVNIPRDYFASLESLRIDSFVFPVPSSTLQYLEFKYGKNWRVPASKEWIYWRDDGGVVSLYTRNGP